MDLFKLAMLEGSEVRIIKDTEKILEFVSRLNEVDTSSIEPFTHPVEFIQTLREDKPSEYKAEFLRNFPESFENYIKVKKVIE